MSAKSSLFKTWFFVTILWIGFWLSEILPYDVRDFPFVMIYGKSIWAGATPATMLIESALIVGVPVAAFFVLRGVVWAYPNASALTSPNYQTARIVVVASAAIVAALAMLRAFK